MREILGELQRWQAEGRRIALARVVDIEGSGPRGPGAAMAVTADGEVTGSVSGGCVEGAVVTEVLAVLAGERDPGRVTFGYSDETAFAVGLTCGGTVHLFVEELGWPVEPLAEAVGSHRPVALATVVEGSEVGAKLLVDADGAVTGGLGEDELDRVVARDAVGELDVGRSGTRHYGPCGEAKREDVGVFIESFAPPPELWVFGAVDFTAALVRVAKVLGYRVTVCDAREVFATERRFPEADEVRVDWPHRLVEERGAALRGRDAICVLTHDAKFDVPAIVAALGTEVGYVGAMGSRRTHAERVEGLRAEGVSDDDLARLMAPIGLDIGSRTPEEVAVAICAEIIATRTGRTAPRSLRDTTGAIHAV